jgi:cell division septation protein DedD
MNLEELMLEAKNGNMIAQYDLAEQYGKRLKEAERDEEIKEYSRQAVYWLKQSARQGYSPAVEAVRELNIKIDPEPIPNETADQVKPAAAEAQKPGRKLSGDTRVMQPIGSEEDGSSDRRSLQEARQKADSVSRTNLLLMILLGISLLLNIFLVVFLYRTIRGNEEKPAPKPSDTTAVSAEPADHTAASASPSMTPSATPAATEAPATPEPTAEPTQEPGRKGWLDLSKYPDLEVVPGEDSIYDDYVYYAVTVSSALNMRSGPGTSYKQIGSIPDATKVGAVAKSDGGKWYLVYYDGKFGWVSSGYLTTNLNYATASPSPAQ